MMSLAVKIGIKAGLITAIAILLVQVTYLLLIYQYFKLEYYLAAVAILFLAAGYVIANLKSRTANVGRATNLANQLTAREVQIFDQILAGKTNKEIAADHFVEISTVKTHINNLYAKLEVSNRRELKEKFGQNTPL